MRNNKKGFTIIELVVVIAVIAILAGVMIPTFSGIINKGKESSAMQQASAAYHSVITMTNEAAIPTENADDIAAYIRVTEDKDHIYWYKVVNGSVQKCTSAPNTGVCVEALSADPATATDGSVFLDITKHVDYAKYFVGHDDYVEDVEIELSDKVTFYVNYFVEA